LGERLLDALGQLRFAHKDDFAPRDVELDLKVVHTPLQLGAAHAKASHVIFPAADVIGSVGWKGCLSQRTDQLVGVVSQCAEALPQRLDMYATAAAHGAVYSATAPRELPRGRAMRIATKAAWPLARRLHDPPRTRRVLASRFSGQGWIGHRRHVYKTTTHD
jgi:hypothetical protein